MHLLTPAQHQPHRQLRCSRTRVLIAPYTRGAPGHSAPRTGPPLPLRDRGDSARCLVRAAAMAGDANASFQKVLLIGITGITGRWACSWGQQRARFADVAPCQTQGGCPECLLHEWSVHCFVCGPGRTPCRVGCVHLQHRKAEPAR